MTNEEKLHAQLKLHEGFRLFPYKDTEGFLTIGVGRNLQNVGISSDECEVLLASDIRRAKLALQHALPWTESLDEIRKMALIELVFNMGIGNAAIGTGLLGFKKTLSAIQRSLYDEAADNLLLSKWANQVGATRARRISEQIRTGQWQS